MKKYYLDNVFYATLPNGQVEVLIQDNWFSVDNRCDGHRIYLDVTKTAVEHIADYYKSIKKEYQEGTLSFYEYCL